MEIEIIQKEIINAIIKKIKQFDLKSKVVSETSPFIIDYQGYQYEIEFEINTDGFFLKTFTRNRNYILLCEVIEVSPPSIIDKKQPWVFMSDHFVFIENIGAEDNTSYIYNIDRFMSEYITRLMQKNLRYTESEYES